jgi:hypothetical protein
VMVVHALNMSLSVCDGGTSILKPSLLLHFHCFHYHMSKAQCPIEPFKVQDPQPT